MVRPIPLLAALLVLSGCGTISRGTDEEVRIDVLPAEARITTSLGPACIGSCSVRASRSADFTVTASAPGYESETVEVRRRISLAGAGGVARNALGGPAVGTVGAGVDLYNRAAYDHVPNPVVIRLRRETETGDADGETPSPPAS